MKALFYGSLRNGFRNHDVARGAKLVGPGRTLQNFRLFVHFRGGEMGIPTAIPDETGYPLVGEVYELPPAVAETVDWLEHGYSKKHVDVKLNGVLTSEPGSKFSVVTDGDVIPNVLVYCCESLDLSGYRTAEEVEATTGDYADVCTKYGKRIQTPIDWQVQPIRSTELFQCDIDDNENEDIHAR